MFTKFVNILQHNRLSLVHLHKFHTFTQYIFVCFPSFQISDEGGGIPRSGLPKIFTYLYSTADNQLNENYEGSNDGVIMAGYGCGLPISRLYARYFGGDLQIISMEGYGTSQLYDILLVAFLILFVSSSLVTTLIQTIHH